MRTMVAGVAAVLVLGAGAACGDPSAGGGGDGTKSLTPLQAAATAVDEAGSSRVEMTLSMDAGIRVDAEMEGAFTSDGKTGEATMTMASPGAPPGTAGLGGTTRMIVDGTDLYMKGGLAETYGGSKTRWGRLDVSGMPGMSAQLNQDPSQYVDFLRAAGGEPEEAGTETVRGVETTRYRTEVEFEDLMDHATTEEYVRQLAALDAEVEPMKIEVWIDESGLPRRISVAMDVTDLESLPGGEMSTDVTVELFDYGVDVDVTPPKTFEELTPPTTG